MGNKFKEFHLVRTEDVHGVSGCGVVARGIIFPKDEKCVVEWVSDYDTVTIFGSLQEIEQIHGHDGRTRVVMGSPTKRKRKSKNKVKR